uniref:Uncharacterized protein n=1 Tax=Micrurus carvalhoi TaxID=3147026 RepID=A0A2H6NF53_9SAUR
MCVCDLPRSSVVREKEIFYKKLGREKGNLNPLNSVLRFSSIESDAGRNPALTAQRDITAAGSRHKIQQTRNSCVSRRGRKQPKSPPPSQSSWFALVRSMPLTSSQDVCKAPESSLRQKRGLAEAGRI